MKRLLWIGKRPSGHDSGDEIFDHRTIQALRANGALVTVVHPDPVGRLREAATLLSGLLPYQRGRFYTKANRDMITNASQGVDAVICSWEPLDALVRHLSPRAILIVHNIASSAIRSMYPRQPLAEIAAARTAAWERKWYTHSHFAAIAALSRQDLAYLRGLHAPPALLLVPPGMPASLPLAHDAGVVAELVLAGTYQWTPKRRDLLTFATAYAALPDRLPLRSNDPLPDALGTPLPLTEDDQESNIRFGVITDRFVAGHKLKTLAYIARNQIVLSFADIGFDFDHLQDATLFVRKVGSVHDIQAHVDVVRALPPEELRQRFQRFKQACAAAFTWQHVARTLLDAVGNAAPAQNHPADRIQPTMARQPTMIPSASLSMTMNKR